MNKRPNDVGSLPPSIESSFNLPDDLDIDECSDASPAADIQIIVSKSSLRQQLEKQLMKPQFDTTRANKKVVHERLFSLRKVQKSAEQCKLEKELSEAKQFSYKPTLVSKQKTQQQPALSVRARDWSERRTNLHKTREDRAFSQCTFTPQINRTFKSRQTSWSPSQTQSKVESPVRSVMSLSLRNRPSVNGSSDWTTSGVLILSKTGDFRRTNKVYEEMVNKEWQELVQDIRLEKQCSGICFDEFRQLMIKHGFSRDEQHLFKVFIAACGDPKSKRGPVLQITNLKALVFSIRNVFDFPLLQNKQFNCASLGLKKVLHLGELKDFQRLHKLLLIMNQSKSQFQFRNRRVKQVNKFMGPELLHPEELAPKQAINLQNKILYRLSQHKQPFIDEPKIDIQKMIREQKLVQYKPRRKQLSTSASSLKAQVLKEFDELDDVSESELDEPVVRPMLLMQHHRPTQNLPTLEARYQPTLGVVLEDPAPVFERSYLVKNQLLPLIIYKHDHWMDIVASFLKYNEIDSTLSAQIVKDVQAAFN